MTQEIRKVGVCGAGWTMGAGIAIVAARAGFETVSYDLQQKSLDAAKKQIAGFFGKSVDRGKMSDQDRKSTIARMSTTTSLERLTDCDMVIEAVFEDLNVKQDLFRDLNTVCGEHAIFASNTSTLSITEIASGCGRDDRVVGMHFCLPAQLMKLIEMAPGMTTSEET